MDKHPTWIPHGWCKSDLFLKSHMDDYMEYHTRHTIASNRQNMAWKRYLKTNGPYFAALIIQLKKHNPRLTLPLGSNWLIVLESQTSKEVIVDLTYPKSVDYAISTKYILHFMYSMLIVYLLAFFTCPVISIFVDK